MDQVSATQRSGRGPSAIALAMAGILVAGVLVAAPWSPKPAGATGGTVLILGSSVTGGSSSDEATEATALGYSVNVVSDSTWDSMTTAQFRSYAAIILGDPTCSTSDSTISAATSNVATWSAAVNGNIAITGTDPVYHHTYGYNSSGALKVTQDAVAYTLARSGTTGAYISLSCYYESSSSTRPPFLADLAGGGFTVHGNVNCSDSGHVEAGVASASGSWSNLSDADLYNWGCSVHEVFTEWPTSFSALAIDPSATPSLFVGADGVAGQPYILVSGTAAASVTLKATLASHHSSPTLKECSSGQRPVNCASGDFWHTFTDASVPGPGPALDLTRTYNSLAASSNGPFGYGWESTYTSSLTVNSDSSVTITEDDGSQVTAEPNGSGGYIAPSWADSTLSYNSTSSTWAFVRQATTTYTYNSTGQLTSIADPNGATTTLSYTSGKLTSVTDSTGRSLTFAYGTNGLVSSVTDPLSRTATYGYDGTGQLTSVTDPMSRVTSFTYDTGGAHLLLTMTDPNGGVTTNVYDSGGRVTQQTDPAGRVTTYAYTGNNFSGTGTTTVTDPDGNVETQDYANGTLTSLTEGSSTWTYSDDPTSLGVSSTTDPNSNTTTNTYDASGNLLSATDGDGNTTTYAYNSFNEPTCLARPMAANPCPLLSPPAPITAGTATITPPSLAPPKYVTYSEYDTAGNLIYQTTGDYAPGSGTASQSRTTYRLYNGQSITLGSTLDSCTTSAPMSELPCATIDADGVVTQLAYDSHGNLTAKSAPDGNSGGEVAKTTYSYDTGGEQTSTVAPNGNLSGANAGNFTTATAYDADGEKTSVTVGGGIGHTVVPRVTTYTYDGDGNVTARTQSASPNRIGAVTGSNSSSSLSLNLPAGTKVGDEAVLSTTTSPGRAGLEPLTANDIYNIVGTGTAGTAGVGSQATVAQLNGPEATVSDAAGNLYIATVTHCVDEVPATSGTQWGQSMTAGDLYTVAGVCGSSGHSGDGGVATSALLDEPQSVALDSSGDLYIGDFLNNRVQEVAATTHSQWGQSMTAGDIYTMAGSSSGSSGHSGNGGAATSALLERAHRFCLRLGGRPLHRRLRQQPGPRGGGHHPQPVGPVHDGERHLHRGRVLDWFFGTQRRRGRGHLGPPQRGRGHRPRRRGRPLRGRLLQQPRPRGGGGERHPVGPVHDGERHLHHRRLLVGFFRAHRRRGRGHLGPAR